MCVLAKAREVNELSRTYEEEILFYPNYKFLEVLKAIMFPSTPRGPFNIYSVISQLRSLQSENLFQAEVRLSVCFTAFPVPAFTIPTCFSVIRPSLILNL